MASLSASARNYLILVLGYCEMLIYCGPIYGWAALVYVLKKEGFYRNLCQQNQTASDVSMADYVDMKEINSEVRQTCLQQDAILNLVFTIASFVFQGSLAIFGVLFDQLGTRFTRLLLHIMIVVSLLLMLLASPEKPHLIFPSMILLAMGGGQLIPTNIQIGNLFENYKSTAVSALSGAVDASAVVFVFIKIAYDEGSFGLQTSCTILICLTTGFFINTFIFLPTDHIPQPCANEVSENKDTSKILNGDDDSVVAMQKSYSVKLNNYPTLKSCVCSPNFVLLTLWFGILQLRTVFYVGVLNPYLVQLTDNNMLKVSHYTDVFSYLQFCAIIIAPFSGLILDRNKCMKGKSNTKRGPYDDLKDTVFGFVVTISAYVILSVANLIPILEVQYITFVFQVISRTFLYGITVASVSIMFPGKYFASLYGLVSSLGSILLLVQFPLFIVTQTIFGDDPFVINTILLIACLLTYALPMYIYFYARGKNRENVLHQQNTATRDTG